MFSCNRTPSVKSRPLCALPSTVSLQPGSGHSGLCHPPSHTDGRTGRQLPLRPSSIMEALHVRPLKEDGVVTEEEEPERSGGQEEGGMEASSPTGSTTDEDTDEDSEAEPPSVVCRKVSFADAFGLNLVSVKEFDNVEATVSEVSRPPEREAAFPLEEFYMSCLFTVPSSPEELDQRLKAQMLELESIELLPGTTMLRGIIRVVNLGYSKSVYARISLDCWSSYFDLLAEYVPGSSDRETDRFAFKYTLIPRFDREGTRVDFCLRYETRAGTFWANNKEINYVLFCHQRGQAKELGPQVLEESGGYRSKRSCLKAKRISAEEKTKETNSTATPSAGAQVPHKAQEADRQTADSTETHSLLHHEGHKALVDGVKSWPRGARVQEDPSQRQQARRVYSRDSAGGQKIPPPGPAPWCDSVSNRYNRQKKPNDSPPVLTYHQIPLLTLDWKSDTLQKWGAADMDDIWAGNAKQTRPKASVENIEAMPSVNDLWETFLNATDDTGDKETSVGDVWQEFLTEPSRQDHSGVPEAEWLQTAASVSPSNHREPQVQVGTDAPTTSHTSATTSSNFDHQPYAEACVCDNMVTRDASQRSQTNSVTHTLQECNLKGVRPVSGGSVDRSDERHMLPVWERVGKRGEAEGAGGEERGAPHTADLVTSSGESKTADMTEMPESQNASAVDRISQRARLDEGLSSSGEGEVTGTAHNETRDTLAFRETIRQGTEDGERFVFSTSRETAGRITTNCTENQASTEEKLFRPRETEACDISQRHADEKRSEEFGLSQKSENPLMENERDENEIKPEQSHAHKFNPNQTCEENIRPSPVMEGEFKLDGSEKDTASSDKDQEGFRQLNSLAWQRGDASVVSEVHNKQLWKIRAAEELHDRKEEEKNLRKSEMTAEKESLSCSGINVERQEINPSAQSTHNVEIKVLHSDTFPADRHILNPTEVEGLRLKSSQDVMRGRREGTGREMSPEEITVKGNIDAQTEPRHQPAIIEGVEEDMILREEDERRLKTEATRGSMGNVEDPRVERKNTSGELKEREKVENPQHVECRKLSEGTNDLVMAEKTVALESRVEEAFIERFGEDFVRRIWEEVFGRRAQDTNIVDGMKGSPADITCDRHPLFEKCSFSLTDPNLRIHQGQEEAIETSSKEHSLGGSGQLFGTINQTQTDLDSSAHPVQELAASLTESAQTISSAKEQENASEIRKRSITGQETGGQTEDCNRSAHPFHKHPTFPSEKLKESDNLVHWSLHVLRHITRLLLCTLLVAGFFTILFLYDFPAFIALYVFSGCWWFYKWRRHRVPMHQGVGRKFAEKREGVEECGA
ncbi:uncharacterized protein ppp1r3aa isoform X2 [Hippoglossus hippoglossus]|uniref:uncharacterized protein ppp1r3aa isoform X2 n=1 Tax=Hippoglossus hippoglossus TaxID=8267 RepID=UPI00148CA3C1|nr:uncharacterized protein ppp1r3aa isoform X2 [Hippoglossus hippoglossus]